MATSLKAQVECVLREVGMREKVFPRLIMQRKMSEAKAGEELARMKAVGRTLAAVANAALGDRQALETIVKEMQS